MHKGFANSVHPDATKAASDQSQNCLPQKTRAVVGQRSSPAGYILYCNIFIVKKFKMYNNNKTQTQKAKSLKHEI